MNVLSLFDGMSCGRIALDSVGIEVDNYYASEIDKHAIKVSKANWPKNIQLGDITNWNEWNINWSSIDLVTGGFPCQSWSMAGKQLGDKDDRGMLFWTMLDVMKKVREHNTGANFLIENVKMKKEFEEYITHHTEEALGEVHKILINSALVSAQNRERYYWTSFKCKQPDDKGIVLADIIEHFQHQPKQNNDDYHVKCGRITGRRINQETGRRDDYNHDIKPEQRIESRIDNKSGCLTTVQKDNILIFENHLDEKLISFVNDNERVNGISENERGYRPHRGDSSKSGVGELGRILKPTANKTDTITTSHVSKVAINSDINNLQYRKLTITECERLQTVPDNYTNMLAIPNVIGC